MRKNFFDLKLSQFSKYLNDIGILSESDKTQFQKQFYDISSDIYNSDDISANDWNVNYIYFKDIISNTLVSFINSLSEEKRKLMALNIFMKYSIKEDIIKEKLLKIIKKHYNKYLNPYFGKWKSSVIILPNDLKRTSSSNIITNISNYQKPIKQKYIFNLNDNKENNLTNDNTIDTNNNFTKNNNLKYNNSMANLNSQLLNISTTHDIHNNNYNNSSYYENSIVDNIINNYTYEKKHKQIKLIELNNTYSTKYYCPNNYFNKNNSKYNSNKCIKNYMNKTNYNIKFQYPGRYILGNSNSKKGKNYNLSASKINKVKNRVKVNLEYLNNLSKSRTEHNLIPEKTTQYIKEQEEINSFCTFKPKINKSSSFSKYNSMSNKKSIDRLYLDSKNRISRKELQALKKTNLESKENTFQPKFISSSVKKIKSNFKQRLKDFENTKKDNIKKISADLEKDHKHQYTFTPKINESYININKRNYNTNSNVSKASSQNESMISKRNKIPAYKRLYNDNKDKMIRQEERVKQEMENIKKNSSKTSENSVVDTRKIEELYNDYKSKKNRLKLKQEQIEKEQGITFKPELISEKKYTNKINPNFYEREKKFLEKQQQNIELYKTLLENEHNKNKKKYTQEEKKEIYNNIVTRLYKDGVQKYIQKRNKNNSLDDNIIMNNNEIELMNDNIKNNKNFKSKSHNIIDITNEIEFEQEPEAEIFKPNYDINGLNDSYEQIIKNKHDLNASGNNNFNSNLIPMDLTKSESSMK